MITWRPITSAVALSISLYSTANAVDPNPLESAHWRFEEGVDNSQVAPRNTEVVLDSINDNDLRAFMDDTVDASPTYRNVVPPTPLRSGLANNLSLDFIPNQDVYAQEQNVNNGIIALGGGFTLEAAFNVNSTTAFQGIVGKEGRPALDKLGGDFVENLQTLVLKVRGDNGLLQIEQWDGGAVTSPSDLVQVSSLAPLTIGQWYHAAVVNDGSNLSLWLDSSDGTGYQLQGSVAVNGGALYQGDDPENPSWDLPWTIGRGEFGGGPADFFDGFIDEVRLTNSVLTPSQFLFAPPEEELDGDYNENGFVDAADYTLWRDNLGTAVTLPNDITRGSVDPEDYEVWKSNFGAAAGAGDGAGIAVASVPEPTSAALWILAIGTLALVPRARNG